LRSAKIVLQPALLRAEDRRTDFCGPHLLRLPINEA